MTGEVEGGGRRGKRGVSSLWIILQVNLRNTLVIAMTVVFLPFIGSINFLM